MFSPDIVESEEFLTMPISCQALYFHLAMGADDDGFIQPKMVMRMIGANDDDLRVLASKRFILTFETGVIVIKHWLIHNMIRVDRYKPTRFKNEKQTLKIKENKGYTEINRFGCQNVNQMAAQVRLGKVRLGQEGSCPTASDDTDSQEISGTISNGQVARPDALLTKVKKMSNDDFDTFWQHYPRHDTKATAKAKLMNLEKSLLPKIIEAIEIQKKCEQWQDPRYIPQPTTWINQRRWEDEIAVGTTASREQEMARCIKENGNDGDKAYWMWSRDHAEDKEDLAIYHFFKG